MDGFTTVRRAMVLNKVTGTPQLFGAEKRAIGTVEDAYQHVRLYDIRALWVVMVFDASYPEEAPQ